MNPSLDHHIAELLALYDCVIVPDFGGFVTNPVGAKHDEVQRQFSPPSKALSFNRNLTQNDGLLADHVARQHGWEYAKALHEVREWVLSNKGILQEGRRVELSRIGILYEDAERNVQFIADDRYNHLAESFGLGSVHVPAIKAEKPAYAAAAVIAEKPTVLPVTPVAQEEKPVEKILVAAVATPEPENETKVVPLPIKEVKDPKVIVLPGDGDKKRRRWPMLAMAGVVLLGAFYAWHIPSNTDFRQTGKLQWGHLNPFHQNTGATLAAAGYEARADYASSEIEDYTIGDPEWVNSLEATATVTLERENGTERDITVILQEPVAPALEDVIADHSPSNPDDAAPVNSSKRYHVISGCFQVKENAESLVAMLKAEGLDAVIVDKKGSLWRVSAGAYDNRGDAKTALNSFTAPGRSAWILKK